MPELAVKTKYDTNALEGVRAFLRFTFPAWGIACGLVFSVASVMFVYCYFTYSMSWLTPTHLQTGVCLVICCLAAFLTGLTLTKVLSRVELIVDKNGITLPVLPDQLEYSMRFIPWISIVKVDVLGNDSQDWKNRILAIHWNNGKPIKLRLSNFEVRELEQMLLAIELWSQKTDTAEALAQLKEDITAAGARLNSLSYTDMWEEELRRRYCPTSFVPLEPGRALRNGSLRVVRHLALGGLAAVYLCDLNEKELVVIKEAVIPDDAQESVKQKAKEMFEREANLLMKLDHPGIVKVRDFFAEGGRNYLMLDYLNGQDLRQFVKQNGAQSENQVVDWAIQIGSILKHLHEQDPPIIHRDLTPDNLVITSDGSIVVIDFGAANEFIGTATGTLVGKQSYIAPEQFRGKAMIESDIYALGCTLYFMLTGEEPEALSTSNPKGKREGLSAEICELVESCTEMEPEDRYRTAAQLLPVLRRLSASLSGSI